MVSGAAAAANSALLRQVGENKQLPVGKLSLPIPTSAALNGRAPSSTAVSSNGTSVPGTTTSLAAPAITASTTQAVTPSSTPASVVAGPKAVGGEGDAPNVPTGEASASSTGADTPNDVEGVQVTPIPATTRPGSKTRSSVPTTVPRPPESEPPATSARPRPSSTPPTTRVRTTSTTHQEDDGSKKPPDD